MGALLTSAALDALPPDRLGVGSGLLNTLRLISVLFGIAVLGLALRVTIADAYPFDGPALAATQAGDVGRAAALSDSTRGLMGIMAAVGAGCPSGVSSVSAIA